MFAQCKLRKLSPVKTIRTKSRTKPTSKKCKFISEYRMRPGDGNGCSAMSDALAGFDPLPGFDAFDGIPANSRWGAGRDMGISVTVLLIVSPLYLSADCACKTGSRLPSNPGVHIEGARSSLAPLLFWLF
jgi:hypothetical protein